MDTPLKLILLDTPQIFVNRQPLPQGVSKKARALLFYLAMAGRAQARDSLMALFWPEMNDSQARNNLRAVLPELNKALGDHLSITTETVKLETTSHCWVDVHAFETTLAGLSAPKQPSLAALGALQQALQLYQGEFLQGFHIRNAAPFEDWLLGERERLRLRLIDGLTVFSEQCIASGDYASGISAARRLLTVEPWLEQGHLQLMRLLAHNGQRSEALQQYERCKKVMRDKFDVAPSEEINAFYRQIRTGDFVAPRPSVASTSQAVPSHPPPAKQHSTPNNLTRPLSVFVGRSRELAYLCQQLADDATRLVTIIGPGGMGKTSLAQEVGLRILQEQQISFPDGIFFVPLADIGTPVHDRGEPAIGDDTGCVSGDDLVIGQAIVRAIAEQIGYKLEAGVSPIVQLQAYLRTRRLLLILDNFEHLLAGSEVIVTLLTHAPPIKVLISSRVRLNVRGETLLVLDKLSLPAVAQVATVNQGQATRSPVAVADGWQTSEAIAMFVQRAQSFDWRFTITDDNLASVVQICHLVDGLPLGIELATSMLPMVSCDTLAKELTQSLAFLQAETRDLPAEQQTLQAVFERSWRLLSPEGQRLLAKLAIFPSTFRLDAAERVAGTALVQIKPLLDQSLLSRAGNERYLIHRTIRAFAEQKLQQWPEQIATLQAQYVDFYLQFLARMENEPTEATYTSHVKQIHADLDNVRTAWRWAVNRQKVAELKHCVNSFYFFYELQGYLGEAADLCDYALRQLLPLYQAQPNKVGAPLTWLIGRLQTCFADASNRLGRFAQGKAAFEASWAIWQQEDDPLGAAFCLGQWGGWMRASDLQQSAVLLTEAVRRLHANKYPRIQATMEQLLGGTILLLGDYAQAEAHITTGYTLAKELTWPRGLITGHRALGRVNVAYGRYHLAEEHLRQAIEYARHYHFRVLWIESLLGLGEALRLQGKPDKAKACFGEARQLTAALGLESPMAYVLWEEGCLAEQSGEYQTARTLLTEGLRIGLNPWWSHALPTLGWALIGLSEFDEAQAHFQKVLNEAEAKQRHPICLDAQVGLIAIQLLVAQPDNLENPTWVEKSRSALQAIYQHPATSAETRQRIVTIADKFGRLLPTNEMVRVELSLSPARKEMARK